MGKRTWRGEVLAGEFEGMVVTVRSPAPGVFLASYKPAVPVRRRPEALIMSGPLTYETLPGYCQEYLPAVAWEGDRGPLDESGSPWPPPRVDVDELRARRARSRRDLRRRRQRAHRSCQRRPTLIGRPLTRGGARLGPDAA